MKTPLEELIENWEKFKPRGTSSEPIWNAFIDDAKKALTKEKEQREELIKEVCYEFVDWCFADEKHYETKDDVVLDFINEVIKPKLNK
jgi:hypothetical protein